MKQKKKGKSLSKLKKELWALISRYKRQVNPTCEICLKEPSNQVHHIIPRARGNSVYFEWDNLLAVCSGCHMAWHNRMSLDEQSDIVIRRVGLLNYNAVEHKKNSIVKLDRYFYERETNKYTKLINANEESWAN